MALDISKLKIKRASRVPHPLDTQAAHRSHKEKVKMVADILREEIRQRKRAEKKKKLPYKDED